MRKVINPQGLAQLVKVTQLGCDRAYLDVAQTAAYLSDCQDAHQLLVERETQAINGWTALLDNVSLSPELMILWSHTMDECRLAAIQSSTKIKRAVQALESARKAWLIALQRVDVLSTQLGRAQKMQRNRHDERQFAFVEDMVMYKELAA